MGCDLQCFRLLSVIVHQFAKKKGYNNKIKGRVFACFIDFKKAYESVNHKLLWKKIISTGISSKVLNLLRSMYKNISCRVKMRNFVSDSFLYSMGVKLGCVLSPLLFNIFINDIVEILRKPRKIVAF